MRLAGAILVAIVVAQLAPSMAAADAPATPPEFLARVLLDAPGAPRDLASFGAARGATSAYDVGQDVPKPPPPPEGTWAMAYVLADAGPSSRLARSLEGPSADAAWTVRAEARGPAGAVRLSWEASDLATLPQGYGVDATHGGTTFDAMDVTELTLAKPEGLWSADVVFRVHELGGTLAAAPSSFSAQPGPWPGEVSLAWAPPEDDGGHPVRRYVLWRVLDGEATEIARTDWTSFTDPDRPAGAARYRVAALTRLGIGDAAFADVVVAGVPGPLAPEASTGEGDTVADERAEIPAGHVGAPSQEVDAASVETERDPADPRRTRVGVGLAGQAQRNVTLFTVVERPAATDGRLELLETPGAGTDHPGLDAGASATSHASGRSPTGRALTLRVEVDGHVTSVDVAWLP